MKTDPFPKWMDLLGENLVENGLMEEKPDQCIINEYLPGQGISRHIDCVPCFGDRIVSISLLSGCVMEFQRYEEVQELYLEPRSLVLLTGDARYKWTHCIPARKFDGARERVRRISLTFRNVIIVEKHSGLGRSGRRHGTGSFIVQR